MGISLKKNERSWAIELIQIISAYVDGKPDFLIKRAGGETTINTGNVRMFPDVLLYGDDSLNYILQGWELKMPDVPIDDVDFVADAIRKARNLNLKSTVICNFRFIRFYEVTESDYKVLKEWDLSSSISQKRVDVETYKELWANTIKDVVDEVNRYLSLGGYKPLAIEKIFLTNTAEAFIKQNNKLVADALETYSQKSAVFNSFIELWWDTAKEEYVKDEKNKFVAYSKVILLDWLNKFTFAHILKYKYPTANKVSDIGYENNPVQALNIFKEITEKCDFYSIFHQLEYEEILPEIVWTQLIEINNFLNHSNIGSIEHSDLQSVLEGTVLASQRVVIGQYTTPYLLADFVVKATMDNINEYCLDPCCGTGTFAKALLNNKISRGLDIETAYKTVFAEDRQKFPLQIAGLSTVSKDSINVPSYIFQNNVFSLKVGDIIKITNPNDGTIMDIQIPKFNSIVSNLPFIDFTRNKSPEYSDEAKKIIIANKVKEKISIDLSYRCDYYVYIMFHLWNLLEENGKLTVITSNSWLGTAAGNTFIEALSYYYNIKGVVLGGNKRWFSQAKVITTIFFLEKKTNVIKPSETESINFYLLNSRLEDLSNPEIMRKATGSILQNRLIDKNIVDLSSYTWEEIKKIKQLKLSFNPFFHKIEWIKNIASKLVPIKNYFDIFRGVKTGQDDIFITADKEIVDSPYIFPMLKNSKNIETLSATTDYYFITCDKSESELRTLEHIKTLNYFKQFEGHLNQSVLSHSGYWYDLKEASKKATLITALNPDRRLFVAKFPQPSCINQRLIGLHEKSESVDINICYALMNTIFGMLSIETSGFGRGDGVLDISKDNFAESYILNPDLLNQEQKNTILSKFEIIKNRNIESVFEELDKPDRIDFDNTVLKAFGIESYYGSMRETLLSMMRVRLNVK